ncbi:MAG TPA: patatin-like phospholipase family protein [Chitinophagaceae bacterium]|nr:patatin-like phospholipase family protein [Chitinophagaceae bacterium]
MSKTKYFQNCLGVFQGGGCKAIAYAGAYKEAVKWGVSFSELVGTSAGAIAAIFIGAGATPAQLEAFLRELDFKNLLLPPIELEKYKRPRYSGYIKFIPLEFTKRYHRVFSHLGLYNSDALKKWIGDKLKILLPHVDGPVKFQHLIIPTSVVVTDLVAKRVEVYSQDESWTMDVSEAVQSSCSIPYFFQPINMRYVDGGVLSNLPAFVFGDKSDKLYNRILAFSLESDLVDQDLTDFMGFSKALLNTVLEGNLDLQLSLQEDLHIININTGKLSAIDFDKVDDNVKTTLIQKGEEAVNTFFMNEVFNVHSRVSRMDVARDEFNTNNFLLQSLEYKHQEILIADWNSKWVYELFPTLIRWQRDGAKIWFFLKEVTDEPEHTGFRQRFLQALGVNVVIVNNLPFYGFIFDAHLKDGCRAIIKNPAADADKTFKSRLYSGEVDFLAINALKDKLQPQITKAAPSVKIRIEKVKKTEVLDLMKNVRQYSIDNVQMDVREIKVSDVLFLTKFIKGYKYRQIHVLFELFRTFGLSLFEPAKLMLNNDKYTLFAPPVVEKIGNRYFVVGGNTRFTYAYRNNIEYLQCIVVEGVEEVLPSKGEFPAKQILLTDKNMSGDDRYPKFDYTKFRQLERAIRDPDTWLHP